MLITGLLSQLREALESRDFAQRLRAMQRYTRTPGGLDEGRGGPAFPLPPPGVPPQYAGPSLDDWIPATDDSEILVG